jgi:hypothetical protein
MPPSRPFYKFPIKGSPEKSGGPFSCPTATAGWVPLCETEVARNLAALIEKRKKEIDGE